MYLLLNKLILIKYFILIKINNFMYIACNYQSTEIVGERKLGGEPLKQYFNVLADATDGTNVLPLPEKIVTFGVCNVAYGGMI